MKFALFTTTFSLIALAKPVPSSQYGSISSNYSESNFDQRLSKTSTVPEKSFFGVTWALEKAASMMAPPLIDKCIEFLEERKKNAIQANQGASTKSKDHANILNWLKAISPNMIDETIKILKIAKGAVSDFDGECFGEPNSGRFVANTVQDLQYLTSDFLEKMS